MPVHILIKALRDLLIYCYFFFDSHSIGLIQYEQNILQYQSTLQNPRSILVQPVELFSARMYE